MATAWNAGPALLNRKARRKAASLDEKHEAKRLRSQVLARRWLKDSAVPSGYRRGRR